MKTGDTLPNGAVVLEVEGNTVLGKIERSTRSGGTRNEYVTWKWDEKNPATTTYGQYFNMLSLAALSFEKRVRS